VGLECPFCFGHAKTLLGLDGEARLQILKYFKSVEDRVPIPDCVSVCLDCHRVNDDKISSYTIMGLAMRCKVCGKATVLDDSMVCKYCNTEYQWTSLAGCGDHLFLLPCRHSEAANTNVQRKQFDAVTAASEDRKQEDVADSGDARR
jgi:hypothetical protein